MAITMTDSKFGGSRFFDLGGMKGAFLTLKLDGSTTTFVTGFRRIIGAWASTIMYDDSGSNYVANALTVSVIDQPVTDGDFARITLSAHGTVDDIVGVFLVGY